MLDTLRHQIWCFLVVSQILRIVKQQYAKIPLTLKVKRVFFTSLQIFWNPRKTPWWNDDALKNVCGFPCLELVAQDQNSSKVYDWSSWVCNCQRLGWFQLVSFFPAGKSGNTRSFFPNLACLSSPPCPLFQNANRTNGLFLICKLSVRCMLRLWISHTLPIVWKPLNFLWISLIVFTKFDPSGLGTIEFSKL